MGMAMPEGWMTKVFWRDGYVSRGYVEGWDTKKPCSLVSRSESCCFNYQ